MLCQRRHKLPRLEEFSEESQDVEQAVNTSKAENQEFLSCIGGYSTSDCGNGSGALLVYIPLLCCTNSMVTCRYLL